MSTPAREPSENPFVWGAHAAYKRNLVALSGNLKDMEDMVAAVETKIQQHLDPLSYEIDITSSPLEEGLYVTHLETVLIKLGEIRKQMTDIRLGAGVHTLQSRLEEAERSSRVDLREMRDWMVLDLLKPLGLVEMCARWTLHYDLREALPAIRQRDRSLADTVTASLETLTDGGLNGLGTLFARRIWTMEREVREAAEWLEEEKKRKAAQKEWEDEQLLTQLWPVS